MEGMTDAQIEYHIKNAARFRLMQASVRVDAEEAKG